MACHSGQFIKRQFRPITGRFRSNLGQIQVGLRPISRTCLRGGAEELLQQLPELCFPHYGVGNSDVEVHVDQAEAARADVRLDGDGQDAAHSVRWTEN
jgi:hypothetical protein